MAVLTVQVPTLAGTALSDQAAAALGDSFPNDGRTVLVVRNAHVSSDWDVTLESSVPCELGTSHDPVITVVHGTSVQIGPFPVSRFGTSIAVTYEDVTDLYVAARRIP